MTTDDAELVEAAQRGDAAALETLLRRYQPRIYRFGMSLCGHTEDAEEVVQHTLMAMAAKIGDYRSDASLSTWLYSVARSYCVKERRRSKFAPSSTQSLHELEVGAPEQGADESVHISEMNARLRRGLALLEPKYRQVLVLRDVEGLTSQEVGVVLDLSVPAVKSRLHRARGELRDSMTGILSPQSSSPTCPDLTVAFSKYLEGDLAPDDCAAMQGHLEGCAACRSTCDCLKETLALCETVPTPELPPRLEMTVRKALEAFLARQTCET